MWWQAVCEEAGRASELTDQLHGQTRYCSRMGAAITTLLWRVSRRDDTVETLLTGVIHSSIHHTASVELV